MSTEEFNFVLQKDVFGGITIDSSQNYDAFPPAKLSEVLGKSIEHWRVLGVRGVWFKISLDHSQWVPICADNGFKFHHALDDYCMMNQWILTDEPNTLPLYPFTSIGVGGLVLSSKGEVLLMRERRGTYLGWKYPGGLGDPGEDIFQTAEREVREETGVDCESVSVLCFRHQHSFRWKTDDFYFTCLMRPRNGGDGSQNPPRPCPTETGDCRWMSREQIDALPPDEFREFHKVVLAKGDQLLANNQIEGIKPNLFVDKTRKYNMYFIEYKV